MREDRIRKLRSAALVTATLLFGISWSFTLVHIKTGIYPLLWALAMPPLAFYYFAGTRRSGAWKHLPAAALSVYALILWQVSHSYGTSGVLATIGGVLLSGAAGFLGTRISRSAPPAVVAPAVRNAGVSKRARRRALAQR
jgi:hypothetical protein